MSYRDQSVLPRRLERNAEESQREHVLVDFLGKMLSELQVMRDHIQTELPAKRQVTQSVQPPNYPDSIPANYTHDPSGYTEQKFEPVRAAHLPRPHESYE